VNNHRGLRAVVATLLMIAAIATGVAILLYPSAAIALGWIAMFLVLLGVVIIPTGGRRRR
jgi:uncharacterized membrane protein